MEAGIIEGLTRHHLAVTTSTMDVAAALLASGAEPPLVVSADLQTAGRGRFRERAWRAADGRSLLFTLAVPVRDCRCGLGLVPLASGLGLAMELERRLGLHPAIKWPNDVRVGGRKLAGILCEARPDVVLVGMGINCLQSEFPEDLAGTATSLKLALGSNIGLEALKPSDLLPAILESVMATLALSERDVTEGVTGRLEFLGSDVGFRAGSSGHLVRGRLIGLSESGELMLRHAGSDVIATYAAGEISALAPI